MRNQHDPEKKPHLNIGIDYFQMEVPPFLPYRCVDQVEEVLDVGALVLVDDGRRLSLDRDAALSLHPKLVKDLK